MSANRPPKIRAKALPARRQAAADSIDWLGLWAFSVALCAVVLAGIAYFMNSDNVGASGILVGAATIVAIVVRFGADCDEARHEN